MVIIHCICLVLSNEIRFLGSPSTCSYREYHKYKLQFACNKCKSTSGIVSNVIEKVRHLLHRNLHLLGFFIYYVVLTFICIENPAVIPQCHLQVLRFLARLRSTL